MNDKRFSQHLTRVDEATRLFHESTKLTRPETEALPLQDSLGRVLGTDIIASHDIPDLDQSAVDGYAVRAKDTFSASQTNPILLRVKPPNQEFEPAITGGEAMYVHTGSPIPKGSDAVIMIEFTKEIESETIEVYKAVSPSEDVSWRGEDVRGGEVILKEGTRLQPQDLGMLASLGNSSVEVFRRPVVGILSTGGELVSLGSKRERGQVIEINSIILSGMVRECGGEPSPLGVVKDDFEAIRARIKDGLKKSDVLLVTGGTSVGQVDHSVRAIDSLGKPGIVAHGIAMRPGRPTALASIEGKPVLNLSGYPVAAMIGFRVFGKPLLEKLLRTKDEPEPIVRARVTRRVASAVGMRNFVRVHVSKEGAGYVAEPVRTTGSGIVSSMIRANGLLVIPEELEGVDQNAQADIVLFRPIE
jgi:molybdopterin molybdotransferase